MSQEARHQDEKPIVRELPKAEDLDKRAGIHYRQKSKGEGSKKKVKVPRVKKAPKAAINHCTTSMAISGINGCAAIEEDQLVT